MSSTERKLDDGTIAQGVVMLSADVRLSAISDTGSASATVMGAIMGGLQKN